MVTRTSRLGGFPALRDATPGRVAAAGRERRGLREIVEARRRGKGVAAPDRPPGQLGGRRPHAGRDQAADPRRPRAGHLSRRRAGAAPAPRARRHHGDPGGPELRPDARGAARPRGNGIVAMQGDRDFDNTRDRGCRSSGGRRTFRAGRCAWRWRREPSSCPRSSCGCPTADIGRSSRGRSRSTRGRRPRGAPCRRTSSATSRSSSVTSRKYPEQWYCFYPFWDDPSAKGGSAGPVLPRAPCPHRRHEERVVVACEAPRRRGGSRVFEAGGAKRHPPVLRRQEAVIRTGRGVGRDAREVLQEVEDELDVDRLALERAARTPRTPRRPRASRPRECARAPRRGRGRCARC